MPDLTHQLWKLIESVLLGQMRPGTAHWKEKIKEKIFEEVSLIYLIIYWVKNQEEDQALNFENKINFLS